MGWYRCRAPNQGTNKSTRRIDKRQRGQERKRTPRFRGRSHLVPRRGVLRGRCTTLCCSCSCANWFEGKTGFICERHYGTQHCQNRPMKTHFLLSSCHVRAAVQSLNPITWKSPGCNAASHDNEGVISYLVDSNAKAKGERGKHSPPRAAVRTLTLGSTHRNQTFRTTPFPIA